MAQVGSDDDFGERVAKLAAMGNAAVEAIMKEFDREGQTFRFQHEAVLVLKAVSSPQSQAALLDIALGHSGAVNKHLESWSAGAYVSTLRNKGEARRLLVSNEAAVLNTALVALRGQPVTGPDLARVTELLSADNLAVRWASAGVLGADPNPGNAHLKVPAIAAAIEDVSNLPNARKTYPRHHFTYAEITYHQYIQAMSGIQGADGALRQLQVSDRTSGKVRASSAIAMARRGDPSARGALLEVLRREETGAFRVWAAHGLGLVGTPEDISLLRQVAGSDPDKRGRAGSCLSTVSKEFFPVREAAQKAIRRIEARTTR